MMLDFSKIADRVKDVDKIDLRTLRKKLKLS